MAPAKRTAEATRELRAALIEHAQRIVARDGASALTMRALAAEAGCAVGLPYKVFASRGELVAELIQEDVRRLRSAFGRLQAKLVGTGIVAALETTVVDYLAAEKRLERVDPDVDEGAFGFLIAGAIHNLLVSGEDYPRPDPARLERMLAAVAKRLAPAGARRAARRPSA